MNRTSKKIKKTKNREKKNIRQSVSVSKSIKGNLTFSFIYLDLRNPNFCIDETNSAYTSELLSRLKYLSSCKKGALIGGYRKALRNHPIPWHKTIEPDGFKCLPEELQDVEGLQFSIDKDNHGRIHGILLDGIFYIVWLDPDHKLQS